MLKVAGGVGGGGNASGTVTQVNTGTGLTGGPITTSGTIRLANTAVIAGTYGNNTSVAQIVIDAQGRITSASNVSIQSGGTGTVTQVNTGTGLTGGPITASGTVSIANTTVTAASYGAANAVATFTVNSQGQLTAAANQEINIAVANVAGAVPNTVNVLSSGLLSGGGALTGNVTISLTNVPIANVTGGVSNATEIIAGTGLTGGGNLASNVTVSLANTSVTPASYTYASITVDAQGRLTSASNGTTPVTSVTGTSPVVSSGGTTPAISMPAANASTNGYLTSTDWSTFNSKGSGSVTNIATGTGLSGGPITTTGTISLANTAVTAGTYGTASEVSQVTVDAQGRITSAANVAIAIANTAVSGLGTMSTQNASAVVITGGTINAVTINSSTLNNANISATTSANATFATSSLPLVPEGYITISINGTNKKIPYYGV